MIAAFRRWALSKWAAALALLLVAAACFLFTVSIVSANDEQVKLRRYQQCIAAWADQFTQRTTTLSAASTARTNALDVFVRSLATRDQTQELAAYQIYLRASDEYTRQVKANPPPTPPALRC